MVKHILLTLVEKMQMFRHLRSLMSKLFLKLY